ARNAGLGFPPFPDSAAVLLDQLPHGDAERDVERAGFVDVPREVVEFRPVATGVTRVFRVGGNAHRLEPVGPAFEDVPDAGERLDVVDDGRLAEGALDSRERRLNPRPGALAFERFNQSRLLAADVRSGPAVRIDVQAEV